MAPVKRLLSLFSLLGALCLIKLFPQWSINESFLATFLSCLSFVFTVLSAWNVILYPKVFSPLRHLPEPTGNALFMGQFKAIRIEPSGRPQQRWVDEVPNDGLIRYLNIFNEERILITSSEALGEVLVTKNYDFIKPRMMREGLGRLLGVGLLLAEGEEHKVQRKHLMPAFAYRHIKDLYPVFWAKTSELVKAITASVSQTDATDSTDVSQAPAIEISNWSSRSTLDIIGSAGMGHDFGAIKDPGTELNATYRKVFSPSRQASMLGLLSLFLPMWVVRSIPVARNAEIPAAAQTIRKICRQLIEEKKRKLASKDEESGIDIISVALSSGGFTEDNLVDQMMTFLAAGHETTGTGLIWAVHCLCKHPHYQTRLREEIRANLPSIDTSTPITAEILDRLPFLHAVCNEVLRLHPPAALTLRQAAKNTSICGQYVPKGTKIILCALAVNHSKKLWGSDASEFNPERWLGPGRMNTGGALRPYAFLTFLHGPRSCIGQAFAKAEFAVLLAGLVGRFEMELEDNEREIKIQTGVTSRPKDGLRVRMRAVEGW